MTDLPEQGGWTWLASRHRPGVASIGSLMIGGDAPTDEHGHPHQVLVEYDAQDRVLDLLRDESGTPLTWVLTADGTDHVRNAEGLDGLRPAPAEVAAEAESWLRGERRASG